MCLEASLPSKSIQMFVLKSPDVVMNVPTHDSLWASPRSSHLNAIGLRMAHPRSSRAADQPDDGSRPTWAGPVGSIHMEQPQNTMNTSTGAPIVNLTFNTPTSNSRQDSEAIVESVATARADHEVYYHQLLTKKRGFPLWIPGPAMQLPVEYRRQGVSIGDVGIITPTGSFDFLFNIFLPANHPINWNVPQRFSPLSRELVEYEIDKTCDFGPNSYLTSSSVRTTAVQTTGRGWFTAAPIADQIFESTSGEAAILTMPDGASTEDLRNTRQIRRCISENAQNWYEYATESRGRTVQNGDIRVVVGIDKVNSWGIATSTCNSGQTASLAFKLDRRLNRTRYCWDCTGGSGKVGPVEIEINDLIENNTIPQNQCVFVRTMNFTLSGEIWYDFPSQTVVHLVGSVSDQGGFAANRGRPAEGAHNTSGEAGSSSSHQTSSMQGTSRSITSVIFDSIQHGVGYHPSAALHTYLHEKFPNANMVITQDSDWISVLNDDDTVFPEPKELVDRILNTFDVIERDGIIVIGIKPPDPENSTQVVPFYDIPALDRSILERERTFEAKQADSYVRMTPLVGKPPLRLLALDGGGIRGLSELLIIKEIMHRLMVEENTERTRDGRPPLSSLPKPCDYFDLIGGTSTGGMIAVMLGRLRMDVDTAIKHYDKLAEYVFTDQKKWGDEMFKTRTMEEAAKFLVQDITGNSESPLLESGDLGVCRTFVCAMNADNMSANIPVLFRTYQSHESHSDCKIWEALRATSAAPTFFKPIEIGRNRPFIDAGLGSNNPSRLVLHEAKCLFGSHQVGLLLSIGTGMAKMISIVKPGIFQRTAPTNAIDALKAIATDCEATHETMVDLFANFQNTYFRLNVDPWQEMQGIKFSEWERPTSVEAHTTQYMRRKDVDWKLGSLVQVIRDPKEQITIERLLSPWPLQHVEVRKRCPLPVASFTGRNEILEKMRKYFDLDGNFRHVFVLYGLGGSGKSQLAFKFLQESQTNKRFVEIFYIDATSQQTLERDLGAIAPGNVERSVDASLRWLANQCEGDWMLFFDNADDVHLGLEGFFPPCASGNILVTTRNRELCHYAAKSGTQNVAGMDHEDATHLLLRLSDVEDTDENRALAAEIVQELHHFTLAISQAGGFIRCHSSLRYYRELLQSHRDNLLQHDEVQRQDPYRLAVYATWSLSFDQLDTSARSFLQICSMLHHEGISEEMFQRAALSQFQLEDSELQKEVTGLLILLGKHDSRWSSWDFLKVVKTLSSYSLVEYDHQNRTYSLHPLLHHWIGTTMGKNRHVMRICAVSIIGLSTSWTFSVEDYQYRHALLKHIINGTSTLNPREVDPVVASHLALTYSEQGHWKDSEVFEMVVVEKRKRLLGDDHPDTLVSMSNLANTYTNQGRWRDAEELGVVVIEKRKQVLGDNHPNTLVSMSNLANTYRNQGRWRDAEELEVVVMDKRKRLLGDNHPNTLVSMSNLANTYRKQGRWRDAEELEVVAMEKRKRLLGDDHPDTLVGMSNLAVTYSNQGRWEEAEALEVVVVEKRKRLLGDDHPGTLISMSNLAATYGNQGRWKEAEVLEVVVMDKRKRLLGDDHPNTLVSMSNLAATYSNQGRWGEAEALEVVVVEKRKRLLGDDHPGTFVSMSNLAATYGNQGRWKEAEVLEVVVMDKRKRLLGDDHPNTLVSMSNLAATYSNQGRWKEAEALEVVVVEKRKRLLGDDHPGTLVSMSNLAATYGNQGRWKEAEVLEVVVVEKRKRLLGDDHPDTLASMLHLANICGNQDRLKEADGLEIEVMKKRKRVVECDQSNVV